MTRVQLVGNETRRAFLCQTRHGHVSSPLTITTSSVNVWSLMSVACDLRHNLEPYQSSQIRCSVIPRKELGKISELAFCPFATVSRTRIMFYHALLPAHSPVKLSFYVSSFPLNCPCTYIMYKPNLGTSIQIETNTFSIGVEWPSSQYCTSIKATVN